MGRLNSSAPPSRRDDPLPRKGSRGRCGNRRTGVAGGGRLAGMTRRTPVQPAHYRLSPETWTEIVEAYRDGATARELAVKWKVSPGSVYYHACRDGWSKKANGDDRARDHARRMEAETELRETARAEDRSLHEQLFSPEAADQPEAADPAHLARIATLASGRAMIGRLWAEAKALAGLAESYARLARMEVMRDEVVEPVDPDHPSRWTRKHWRPSGRSCSPS